MHFKQIEHRYGGCFFFLLSNLLPLKNKQQNFELTMMPKTMSRQARSNIKRISLSPWLNRQSVFYSVSSKKIIITFAGSSRIVMGKSGDETSSRKSNGTKEHQSRRGSQRLIKWSCCWKGNSTSTLSIFQYRLSVLFNWTSSSSFEKSFFPTLVCQILCVVV